MKKSLLELLGDNQMTPEAWRKYGEEQVEVADAVLAEDIEKPVRAGDPDNSVEHAKIQVLLGIYSELRFMSGDGEQAESMRQLAHALVVHSSTIQEHGSR